jgi:hypothetical protein
MEVELRDTFTKAITSVFDRVDAASTVTTLLADGWDELCAADQPFALGTLFETTGRTLNEAAVFDLTTPPSMRGRPVFPFPGRSCAAWAVDGTLDVDGIVLGPGRPDAVVVTFGGRTNIGSTARINADALEWSPVVGIDPSAGVCRVHGRLAVEVTGEGDANGASLRDLLRRCIGHELVGLAEEVSRSIRGYVIERSQFGRPIGSWQSVQHRLADAHIELIAARSTLDAAWADSRSILTAVARNQAGIAAATAVVHAQQLYGAIGFTWEHDLHRYVRRFQLLDALLGSRSELRREIGVELMSIRTLEGAVVRF